MNWTGQIIIFISLVFFCSCSSTSDKVDKRDTKTNDLTEEEIYSVLNQIIEDDSLQLWHVCKFFDTLEFTRYRMVFDSIDQNFISRQNKLFKNLTIRDKKLKRVNHRLNIAKFLEIDTSCKEGIIPKLSFPFISADRTKVVFQIYNDCNCMLGSGATTYLFEKKNSRWTRTKILDSWISEKRSHKCNNSLYQPVWRQAG